MGGRAGKGDALTAYCLDALEKMRPKIEIDVRKFRASGPWALKIYKFRWHVLLLM